ncbi:MAG: type II toxin-antitoxin system PemK/MazF family toxin [Nitrospira sp.]|nr:type II toxin-antitoxin system PemK/MazF family toxin [Nitrospira sp.]
MKQRDIWLINLEPGKGAEIKKTRPCIILNDDSMGILPLKVVAPITDFKEKYENVPWMVKLVPDNINNLKKTSVIDTFQIRSVSEERLIRKIGEIGEEELKKVMLAIQIVFGM